MYKFRVLEAYYDVDIVLIYPDFMRESYHCREHVIVHYNREPNVYLFDIVDRKDIQINGKAPEERMDQMMIELGDALYSFSLRINPDGELLKVYSFGEIQDRWFKKAKELLNKNETAPFKKYLQISQRNMKTEETFRETLLKNSFFKFYFLPDNAESFLHEVHHFPQRSDTTLFLFESSKGGIIESENLSFTAKTVFPEEKAASGKLNRQFTELGDLDVLRAEMNWENEEGMPYQKTITIRVDETKRDILKANKFWSFILD